MPKITDSTTLTPEQRTAWDQEMSHVDELSQGLLQSLTTIAHTTQIQQAQRWSATQERTTTAEEEGREQ